MDNKCVQLIDAVCDTLHGKRISFHITEDLLALAKNHQVQNFLLVNSPDPKHEKLFYYYIARSIAQDYAIQTLVNEFEKRKLTIVPIKGICTKQRYPNALLRTMADIDVLCDPEQTKAVQQTMGELGYGGFVEGRVHDSYSLPPHISIEMHKALVDGDTAFFAYYQDILDRCRVKQGFRYAREMTLEDEYIFNIVHLIGHFKRGGIGMRFVVDVYIYEHTLEFQNVSLDREYLEREFNKLGINIFYKKIRDLALHWFGTEAEKIATEGDPVLDALGEYILSGGLFGKQDNYANINANNGKFRMLIRACFPEYKSMKSMFPWLPPILLPYGWLLRGWRAFKYRRRNINSVWKTTMNGDAKVGKQLKDFFASCGLKM